MSFKPWYNNELLNFLEGFLKPEFLVFEYGAGHSTLYYSRKVAKVFAIETRKEWLDFVLVNQILPNIEIKLCLNLPGFANEIENFSAKFFDVIVVDSRDRAQCLLKAVGHLRENGLLILDNSERPNLLTAKQHLLALGFVEKLFSGRRDDESISFSSIFFQP